MNYTDVGGVPVTLTETAWEKVMRSGAQGSIFPQALAEMFGQADIKASIHLDCVEKRTVFPGAGDEEHVLVLTVTPEKPPKLAIHKGPYIAYTNASDLAEQRAGGKRGFHAVDTAREQVRLYKLFYEMR
jgi:hypothetical protein